MKLRILTLLLACLLLAGCGLYNRDYASIVPFTGAGSGESGGDAREISNYNMLRSAILDLINTHTEHAVFRFSSYSGSVGEDLDRACQELQYEHPLGAWAVEAIRCDFNRVVSYDVADLNISFLKNADEIASVVFISSEDELRSRLRERLENYAAGAALRIYSTQVDEARIQALLEELYFSDPVSIAAEPLSTVQGFPAEGGANRIYELHIDYGDSQSSLRQMTAVLRRRVPQLCGELSADAPVGMALAAARLVSAALAETEDDLASTAYGALVLSEANDKGAALAYEALCAQLEIPCQVVSGQLNGVELETHFWNMICLDGAWYHVDVSRLAAEPRQSFLVTDAALRGSRFWDTERYPACTGTLCYADALAASGTSLRSGSPIQILGLPVPGAGESPAEGETAPVREVPPQDLSLPVSSAPDLSFYAASKPEDGQAPESAWNAWEP